MGEGRDQTAARGEIREFDFHEKEERNGGWTRPSTQCWIKDGGVGGDVCCHGQPLETESRSRQMKTPVRLGNLNHSRGLFLKY